MSALSNFINELQSFEEFSFSWEELVENTNAPESTLRKGLSGRQKEGEILNLRKGFYLILPPRYQSFGKLPIELYVDKLFKFLNRSYYISFYSAARLHGASHQQIQQDYIVAGGLALRDIKKGNAGIRFFQSKTWPIKNVLQYKADAGYYNASSPSLTIADLINYQAQLGGLNRMFATIEELVEEITMEDVADLIDWYPINSVLQRMGYILDQLETSMDVTEQLSERLQREGFFPVLLSPEAGRKAGKARNRWKIDTNIKLESDLT